jgi:FKBP-type peptidyl-prolyl cis-trans isomerase FkpA
MMQRNDKKQLTSKFIMGLLAISMLTFGCSKTDTGTCENALVASERAQLVAYATKNGITYTEHSSGMLYQITNPGAGLQPNLNSRVFIGYKGRRMDETVFDSANIAPPYANFILADLIQGWKVGIPLIRKGGSIKLIIPSSMAYGCNGSKRFDGTYSINPNSPLYFEISLLDVQ